MGPPWVRHRFVVGSSWVRHGCIVGSSWVCRGGGSIGAPSGGSLGGLTSAFNAEQLVSFLANFIVH